MVQINRENKLREFHFKFLHRIAVTKKELCRFGIIDDSECLYCGEQDSIEHTFSDNNFNQSSFEPSNQEYLFRIFSNPANKELLNKFNYTLLFFLVILSIQKSYTIIIFSFSSQIFSAVKSPLSTG